MGNSITAYTKVLDFGWCATGFEIPWSGTDDVKPEDFVITGNKRLLPREEVTAGITGVSVRDGILRIDVAPMEYRQPFLIQGHGITVSPDTVTEIKTETADLFEARNDHGVVYRLFTPKETYGPRPLILFLHGGGEDGTDNWKQLVGSYSSVRFAEKYPDMYVMTPQALPGAAPVGNGAPKHAYGTAFKDSDYKTEGGWTRPYLARICDIIREMIRDGKVLADRVYVTGLSMGGAGALRILSVGSDLFAAAAPVCPSMTPETYSILCNLKQTKIWISTAYVDHIIYRHKYIADGIMKLREKGNENAFLTVYSPEELEAYGVGTDPETSYQELFMMNHGSWNLTFADEHGIMTWLTEQVR